MPEENRRQVKIRVTDDQYKLLGLAAAMEGKSMTEFIGDSATNAAIQLLGDSGPLKALVKAVASPDAKPKTPPKAKK